ncbi:MAG: sugar acetyltransferase [Nitrosomonadaceae bacterium]|nr:sugar acetyltransferase [Nitrosomonadaceae bacterium]
MSSRVKSPVILLGAGGHAKVVAEVLFIAKREILGFLDSVVEKGEVLFGVVCLGTDKEIQNYSRDEIQLVNGVGYLPGEQSRQKLAERMRKSGYSFERVIHPTAVLAKDIELGEGLQIMAGAIIQPGAQIGKDTIINTKASVDHDCKIGSSCHIAPGATLSGGVHLGDNVHIGTGASIIQNIRIGDGVDVAAGAIVYQDIPADSKVRQKCEYVMDKKIVRGGPKH